MKKKIAILGSTGSIGKALLKILDKDINNYEIVLLSANKNYKLLLNQAIKYKVKNLVLNNNKNFKILKNKNKRFKINIFNDFNNLDKILNYKIDYVMSSIIGIDGLEPTLKSIKHTKTIAIANKESIICGWSLIKKELKKRNTKFIPVDSEHFTIWYSLKNNNDLIDKLILTASGGPFLNLPISKFKKIKLSEALKHPNWKMGKKITVDSATMMNKVFEVIEARNLFDVNYKKISILTHPNSYLHSITKFCNGIIKIIAHDTNMKIPIFNSIFNDDVNNVIKTNDIDIRKLNKLDLKNVDDKKFPMIKILKELPDKNSLFETVLVAANDELVKQFLNKEIKFIDISKLLLKFLKNKEFVKFKYSQPKNIREILKINKYVRFKVQSKSI